MGNGCSSGGGGGPPPQPPPSPPPRPAPAPPTSTPIPPRPPQPSPPRTPTPPAPDPHPPPPSKSTPPPILSPCPSLPSPPTVANEKNIAAETQKPVLVRGKKYGEGETTSKGPPVEVKPEIRSVVGEQLGKLATAALESKESAELKRFLYKYEALIEEADDPSPRSLQDHIFSGIFLNGKRKKCWVDEKSSCVCFMLFARELSITWGKDHRYWQWLPLQETGDAGVEVARLVDVQWLEIHGKLEVSCLTPGAAYQVAFVVMVENNDSYGWDVPVCLRLVGTSGDVPKRLERLAERRRGEWLELTAGEFVAAADGEIGFSLFEYEDGGWKRGLLVKGVCVRPRSS